MNVHIKRMVTGVAAVAAFVPGFVAAQGTPANTSAGIGQALETISGLIGMLVPIILSLAIVYFMWGVLQYVTKGGEDQAKARDTMLWGIIAIAVMVSIWGLVGILRSTFNISDTGAIPVPHLVPGQQ